ncbi:MAG: TonB-dependent receptor [Cyclobacteriaceae bacterium]|jgi:outer membrane receptor for ferrienterochelin and colicins|nr:TonB-dependent receptor [Cyclobacteriaceae bacterium]
MTLVTAASNRFTQGAYLLVVWLVMFGSSATSAQTGRITGRVTHPEGPAAFANVAVVGTSFGAVTTEDGRFVIDQVPFGKYTLSASAVGYQTATATIQHNQPETTVALFQEEDIHSLQEVVVTGTMREVSKMASPIPVEVYAPSLFRKNPTPNIFEALNQVNGLQPQMTCNVCNTGSIQINGLEGPYTMVLIDGMPIVSSLSTVYGLTGIPNSMVKRIEVVKGPASTLYGSEAVGGLINIITRDPATSARWQADVYGTSVGEVNTDLTGAFKVGRATSLLGVNHFRYDVKRDINNDNFTDVTLQNRISVFNKWSFPVWKNKEASLAGRIFYEDRNAGELQWNSGLRGSDHIYGESIYTNRYELIGTVPLSARQDLSFDYSYNFHKQNSYYGTTFYKADQHTGFAQVRWNKEVGKHQLLIGLPYRYIFYDDNTPGTATAQATNKPSVTHLPGVFVQDEWAISPKVSLLGGLRYDYNNVHGSIVTPRFSAKWAPSSSGVLRLTGGRGFRVVNLFTEDHAALSGARQVEIRSDLRPENSWNGNLNFTQTVAFGSGFVTFDASGFYTYFTNKIVGDFLTDPNKIIYDNLDGHAVSRGFTLNADASFDNGLKLIAGGTWMDVYQMVNQDGNLTKVPQLLAPGFSGTGSLSYTTPSSRWAVDLTARVNGPMFMPVLPNDFRSEKSPWVPLLNWQLTRHFHTAHAHWEIYAGVKNLLNFIQRNPLLHPDDPFDRPGGKYFDSDGNPRPDTNPFGYTFDVAYSYAPVQGLRGFLGVRYTLH